MIGRTLPLLLLVAAGCSRGVAIDVPPEPTDTAIQRYDGTPVTLENLRASRPAALAVADTVARLEKELREPWQEARSGRELVDAVTSAWPADTRTADSAWANAEPVASRPGRQLFREFGVYSMPSSPYSMGPRASPSSIEQFASMLADSHDDSDDAALLRAAWRHFSPGTSQRRSDYLAAYWLFELDDPGDIQVAVSESLLGPHQRSTVLRPGSSSFRGPTEAHDGYMCSVVLIDLLSPGKNSPVLQVIDTLRAGVQGEAPLPPGMLAEGRVEEPSAHDEAFLRSVLNGLSRGCAELVWLPVATRRLTAHFSYLVETGEARATLGLTRLRNGWVLDTFVYQPAGASITGNAGASLDLMPLLRGMHSATGN